MIMPTILALTRADSMHGLALLLDVAAKGLVILLAAAVATWLLRRRSAALRHMIWTLSVIGLLCVPVLSVALPQFQVPLLPDWARPQAPDAAGPPSPDIEPAPRVADVPSPAEHLPPEPPPAALVLSDDPVDPEPTAPAALAPVQAQSESPPVAAETSVKPPLHWSAWVLLAWAAGVLAMAVPMLIGTLTVWWRTHRAARVIDVGWLSLLNDLRESLGVRRPVTLMRSAWSNVPLICGIGRPVILLPAEADGWSPSRRKVVLLHELAHVRRGDCLTQLIARLARVFYWFNPLVWLAGRMLRIERERACDDLVLAAGHKASDYAAHLLDIVRTLRSIRCPSLAAVAMARKTQFEGRLLAILDAKRNRRSLTRPGVLLAAILIAGLVVPISIIKATAADESKGSAMQQAADGAGESSHGTFRRIKKMFLSGDYDAALTALDGKDAAGQPLLKGYRFAKLRARTAVAAYDRYVRVQRNKAPKELGRRAKACKAAFEEALHAAPSRFERGRLYCLWMESFLRWREFDADSEVMRSASPFAQELNRAERRTLAKQKREIRQAALKAVNRNDEATGFAPEVRAKFADVFADEYAGLAAIGVPKKHFRRILADLPVYARMVLEPRIVKAPRKNRLTIQYYLWRAIAGPVPDEIEREVIAARVEEFAKLIERRFDSAITSRLLPGGHPQSATWLRKFYSDHRDNRFIITFHRAPLPHDWQRHNRPAFEKVLDAFTAGLKKAVPRGEKSTRKLEQELEAARKKPFPSKAAIKSLQEQIARSQVQAKKKMTMYAGWAQSHAVSEFSHFSRPVFHHLPAHTVGSSGANANKYGILPHDVSMARPIGPYSVKKAISPKGSTDGSAGKAPVPRGASTQPMAKAKASLGARIAALVVQLESPNYKERDAAQKALVEFGLPAVRWLQKARNEKDPERASRVKGAIATIRQRERNAPLTAELLAKVRELKHLRPADARGGAELHRQAEQLAREYPRPADRGLIYAAVVEVHHNSRAKQPRITCEYARKATALPLGPETRARVFQTWAYMAASARQARQEIAKIYLEGLSMAALR